MSSFVVLVGLQFYILFIIQENFVIADEKTSLETSKRQVVGQCGDRKSDPLDTKIHWKDACYDFDGNSYKDGDFLMSCCGCFKFICSNNTKEEPPCDDKYGWDKVLEATCCEDCHGQVFPAGSVIKEQKLQDKCSTTVTTKCVLASGEKKATIDESLSYEKCCSNSSGVYPLNTSVLVPALCSVRVCSRPPGRHEASWTLTKKTTGCDCCQYRGKLIADKDWVIIGTGTNARNATCCEGKLLVSIDDEDVSSTTSEDETVGITTNVDEEIGITQEVEKSTRSDWTIIQRRGQYGNAEDYFYKDFNEYENGFGSVDGELWIGLKNLAALTKDGEWELQVDLTDWDDKTYYAKYGTFSVGPAPTYKLHVEGFDDGNSTLGDSMEYHNGQSFSARNNDQDSTWSNCAVLYQGGWWYLNCHHSNLNGINYAKQRSDPKGISWYHGKARGSNRLTWKASVIKIRKVQDTARASSTYGDDLWGAKFAIDHVIRSQYGQIYSSIKEDYPWLEISLSSPKIISGVTIFNRPDCCAERFKNAEIRIGMTRVPDGTTGQLLNINTVCGMHEGPGGWKIDVHCSSPILSKYVTIQLKDKNVFLHVNEVQIKE